MLRLCYVTDAGHHPTEFFRNTLRWMRHPLTGKLLGWIGSSITSGVCLYVTKSGRGNLGEGKEACPGREDASLAQKQT
ncbi:MAG: hypothetical protein U1D30_05915 [Planctomycetota bacterium]